MAKIKGMGTRTMYRKGVCASIPNNKIFNNKAGRKALLYGESKGAKEAKEYISSYADSMSFRPRG